MAGLVPDFSVTKVDSSSGTQRHAHPLTNLDVLPIQAAGTVQGKATLTSYPIISHNCGKGMSLCPTFNGAPN